MEAIRYISKPYYLMTWETYIAFGDSITKGARTYLGYPELVGHSLNTHLAGKWNDHGVATCSNRVAKYILKDKGIHLS